MTYYAEMLKSFYNKQVQIKNLKNDASPKYKICSNISYFMQVRMKLCQSKQVDLLFSEPLLRILTLKSAALTSIPHLPLTSIPLFSYQIIHEVRGSDPPPPPLPPPPGKYSSSVPVMHFILMRDGITTNGRTDGRSIRLTDAPGGPFISRVFKNIEAEMVLNSSLF